MRYSVRVKPNSKKGPLVESANGELIIYLRERPVDGAANQALVKILAEYFHVTKSQIVIESGATSRRKIIEIIL